MDLYKAIQEMRRITAEGGTFSFSFMSCSLSKGESAGVVEVRRGQLRKRARSARNRYGEYLLEYYDQDTGQDRRFYYPLLMTFNDQRVTLR